MLKFLFFIFCYLLDFFQRYGTKRLLFSVPFFAVFKKVAHSYKILQFWELHVDLSLILFNHSRTIRLLLGRLAPPGSSGALGLDFLFFTPLSYDSLILVIQVAYPFECFKIHDVDFFNTPHGLVGSLGLPGAPLGSLGFLGLPWAS